MNKQRETRGHSYEKYGISLSSPRHWWRRRSRHRALWRLILLIAVALPIALALWWPTLKPWLSKTYHAYRAQSYVNGAIAFLNKGDLSSARLQFQNALRHDPTNAECLLRYARTLRDLKQPGYAVWAFQAHLAQPADPSTATLALGYSMEERQQEIADFIMRDAIRRHPKDAAIRLLASHHLMQIGNSPGALRSARAAKEIAPDNAEAAFLVASLSSRVANPTNREQAITELKSFREKPAFRSRASWALVNAYAGASPADAIAILDDLAKDEKTAWSARLRHAIVSDRIDRSKTSANLNQLWSDARDAAQRIEVIGAAELLAPQQAQTLLESLDPLERRSPPMLLSQYRIWARSKEWRRIADLANEAAQTDNENDRVINTLWLAKANRELKQNDGERTCIRVAIARCESDVALAMRAAQLLERLGMGDTAIEFYRIIPAKSPGKFASYATSRIAAIERSAGHTAEMLASWEEALRKNPRDPQVMNNVAACLVLTGGDLRRALKLSADAMAARPQSAFFADTYALALAKNGRIDESLAIYQKLPAQRLRNPEFAMNYASVLNMAGRNAEALALVSNLNLAALLPEHVAEWKKITGNMEPPVRSLLLEPRKTAEGPAIPGMPPTAIGPLQDAPQIPGESPLDLVMPPPLDHGERSPAP